MSAPEPWRWVTARVVYGIHDQQLADHQGSDGVRDPGAIASALARPINRSLYEETDAAGLAAAYVFGLAKAHGFTDGNKRTSWVTARVFLADNGKALSFDGDEAVAAMEGVAGGTISEDGFAEWLRARLAS